MTKRGRSRSKKRCGAAQPPVESNDTIIQHLKMRLQTVSCQLAAQDAQLAQANQTIAELRSRQIVQEYKVIHGQQERPFVQSHAYLADDGIEHAAIPTCPAPQAGPQAGPPSPTTISTGIFASNANLVPRTPLPHWPFSAPMTPAGPVPPPHSQHVPIAPQVAPSDSTGSGSGGGGDIQQRPT